MSVVEEGLALADATLGSRVLLGVFRSVMRFEFLEVGSVVHGNFG